MITIRESYHVLFDDGCGEWRHFNGYDTCEQADEAARTLTAEWIIERREVVAAMPREQETGPCM